MAWKHLVIECYCLNDNNGNQEIPSCCKNGIGNVGNHCLDFDEKRHEYCPYLGFKNVRSTVILTDASGNEISFKEFSDDESISDEKKWLEKEQEWLKNWKDKISL